MEDRRQNEDRQDSPGGSGRVRGRRRVTDDELRTAFTAAVASLNQNFGRIDPSWSEANRLVRGDLDLGLGGGPDLLHAVYGGLVDGRFEGVAGDSYVMQVAFLPDGIIVSESVHQFGSATLDEDSPHFADQAPLLSAAGSNRSGSTKPTSSPTSNTSTAPANPVLASIDPE